MKNLILIVSLFVSVPALSSVVVGFVDAERVFTETNDGKEVKKQLESEFAKRKKNLEKDEAELKKAQEQYQKQRAVLKDADRMKKEQEIQEMMMKYQQRTQGYQKEMQDLEVKHQKPVVEKLEAIIKQVSKDEGVDLTFSSRTTQILFVKEEKDLTQKVVDAYNKKTQIILMKLSELKDIDLSFKLIQEIPELVVTTISGIDNLIDDSMILIKEIKSFKKVCEKFHHQHLVIFTEKDWLQLDDSFKSKLRSTSVATVHSMPKAISLFSHHFWKNQQLQTNNLVDGRQMGTVEIDPFSDIAQNVFIGSNVKIGRGTKIFPGVVIHSNCVVGENCILYSNVVMYDNVKIGDQCIIHANTVIGSDGFGFNFEAGIHYKVWHLGNVLISNNVEVGAGCTIDRGTFGSTTIGEGCKIDNLVQIAHNCKIGRGVILCGQIGLAGSSEIGDFSVLGGKAGVGPGVKVGNACQIAGNAMVNTDWPDGSIVAGHPARPLKEWMRGLAYVRKMSLSSKESS